MLAYSTLKGIVDFTYYTHCMFGIIHIWDVKPGSASYAWNIQHESLELAATTDDTMNHKVREQLIQGDYHQEDERRKLGIDLYYFSFFFLCNYISETQL